MTDITRLEPLLRGVQAALDQQPPRESDMIAADVAKAVRSNDAMAEDIRAWYKAAREELDRAEQQAEAFISEMAQRKAALKCSIESYTSHIRTADGGMRKVFTDIANGGGADQ